MADVIFLHGSSGTRYDAEPLAVALGDAATCRSVDLLSHNGRPIPERYGFEAYGDDFVLGMRKAGLKSAFLVGYSWGGRVALDVARRYPRRVQGVCLLATPYRWTVASIERGLKAVEQGRSQNMGREPWRDALADKQRAELLRLKASGGGGITDDQLRALRPPLLAIAGSNDWLVDVGDVKHLVDVVPRSRSIIFEGTGHPISKIPFQIVGEALKDFIRDVEGGWQVAAGGYWRKF